MANLARRLPQMPTGPIVPPSERMTIAQARALGAMCEICPCAQGKTPPKMVPGLRAAKDLRFIAVGEAPGHVEQSQGVPLIGPTGQFFTRLLQESGLDRANGHLTNAALCRADSDRDTQRATQCCAPRLQRELLELPANIPILVMGKQAMAAILGHSRMLLSRGFYWKTPEIDESMVRAAFKKAEKNKHPELVRRARVLEGRRALAGRVVWPTVHPAYVLRADAWKPALKQDFLRFGKIVRGELTEADLEDKAPYWLVRTEWKVAAALRRLGPTVAVDIETDDIDPMDLNILCVGISDGERTVVIGPWDKRKHAQILRRALAKRKVVFHNGVNFDILALEKDTVTIDWQRIEDTLIAHHSIGSHFPQRLDHCVSMYLFSRPWKIRFGRRGLAEKGVAPKHMPQKELYLYNAADAKLTARLWLALQDDLLRHNGMRVYEHDMTLAFYTAGLIRNGLPVDMPRRATLRVNMVKKETELRAKMCTLSGRPDFHPQVAAHVREALFDKFKLKVLSPTPTGLPSTASTTLEVYRGNGTAGGEMCAAILDYRHVNKSRSTYVDGKPVKEVEGLGPRLRVNWKVYGTPSGRWSSPAQSFPRIEYDDKKQLILESRVREYIAARPGYTLVHFDLKQAEAFAAAYLSGDQAFIENCKTDIHVGNACIVFPDKADIIRAEPKGRGKKHRDIAKNFMYGINYLAEAKTIHKFIIGKGFPVTLRQVEKSLDLLRASYRTYFRYVDRNVDFVRHNGFLVSPIIHRMRWFGRNVKPTEVANWPPQSFVGDVMNEWMIRTMPTALSIDPRIVFIGQWHDSVIWECPRGKPAEDLMQLCKDSWDSDITVPPSVVCHTGVRFRVGIDIHEGHRWSDL